MQSGPPLPNVLTSRDISKIGTKISLDLLSNGLISKWLDCFAMFCTFLGYAKTATRLILQMWGCFTVTPSGILVWMTHRKSSECWNTTSCERIKNGHDRQVKTIECFHLIFSGPQYYWIFVLHLWLSVTSSRLLR